MEGIAVSRRQAVIDLSVDQPDKPDWSPWVYLQLEWTKPSEGVNRGLLLTINFAKHHMKVLGGRVWFGLRRGELKLTPSNGVIPYEHRWPESPLEVNFKFKRTVNETKGTKRSRSTSDKLNVGHTLTNTKLSIGTSRNGEKAEEQVKGIKDEFEYVTWRIRPKGSDKEAYWDFEALEIESCLQGRLFKKEICKVMPPCGVRASFRVFKRDIQPIGGEGLWPENLEAVKCAVILALLRRHIVKTLGPEAFLLEVPNPIEE